ncbi:DUF72 domain-containing protein [Niastella populi]|uniref:DUF72 domain-containing protein n=1 Tax=Niastella populi TaxID=550983 RepID=A0A1V9EUK0_9BACT|nr:DUF72 domain-containing protein [Niastella populi]OQP49843.1 hypothetical protein A4R26_30425 [Niastella populi]
MKFGKLPESELNTVNFSLPADPPGNKKILGGEKRSQVKIRIGCPQWGVPGWVGKIYPPKAREKDFLDNYVQHYNCIELNATHYKIYDKTAIAKWAGKAGERDFIFCPKLYQGVTHQGGLLGKNAMIAEFLQGVSAFGKHLGPVFMQLSDSFGPARKEELFTFIKSLPKEITFFLEVRHPDWFALEQVRKELFNTLYLQQTGAVITDTAGRRDCAHMHLTIPKAFVRFVANSLHASDYVRLDAWIERIISWVEQGLQELYFFVHMEEELYSPELIIYFTDKLNTACGLQLLQPKFIAPEGQAAGSQIKFFE